MRKEVKAMSFYDNPENLVGVIWHTTGGIGCCVSLDGVKCDEVKP
jgi:hypothetical protein